MANRLNKKHVVVTEVIPRWSSINEKYQSMIAFRSIFCSVMKIIDSEELFRHFLFFTGFCKT